MMKLEISLFGCVKFLFFLLVCGVTVGCAACMLFYDFLSRPITMGGSANANEQIGLVGLVVLCAATIKNTATLSKN